MNAAHDADPTVQRRRAIDRICDEFHCLPSAAREELDADPEHLALLIIDERSYVRAKAAFDAARDKVKDLQAWTGSPYMTLVETNTFALRRARSAAAGAPRRG